MKHEVITLTDKKYVTLTTYVLDDSSEMLNGKCRPAILICPGGAYLNCSDREAEVIALRYNTMGYHSFVLRYSTYSKGETGIGEALGSDFNPTAETSFPAALIDMGYAMQCINKNAAKWLVDTNRIAICGFSAGAHNCAMYAAYWNKDIVTENLSGKAYKPAAAILAYGVYDYYIMTKKADNPMDNKFRAISNEHYFGTKNPDSALIESVSPARLVDENYPPVFLWATQEDSLVPVQNTCEMALALAKKGVPFESHIYENGQHGLSIANQAVASCQREVNPVVAEWVNSVEEWLLNRFSLDLPQNPAWMELMDNKLSGLSER